MKRRFLITIVMLVLSFSLFIGTNPAHAVPVGDFFNLTFNGIGTCTNTGFAVPFTLSWSVTGSVTLTEVDTVNGSTTYNNTISTSFSRSGASKGNAFSSGPYTASQPYTFSIDLTYREEGSVISHARASYTCSGGVASFGSLTTTPAVLQGPQIPAGFVLRLITCTVPVFDLPAGQVVVPNKIKAGQTWYVKPTSVKGKDGKQWTEIFAGGYIDGYIPTSCVHPLVKH